MCVWPRLALICLLVLSPAAFAEDLTDQRTGAFQITRTLTEVLGARSAKNAAQYAPPDEPITWEVVVPGNYQPENAPGLLVYISPSPSGEIPRGWTRVMEAQNLIWVAANKSGNKENVRRRALLALVAPTLIGAQYQLDRDRVYVSGLSGGGKMASMVAIDYAHIFKGAIYNSGVDFWDQPPPRFEAVKENRFVFITGTQDQALRPTKRAFKRYEKAGVTHIKLMVIRDMGHRNPDADEYSEAIDYLDE
ncbi:MAG: PHB depolymerase family esterase [Pseudomonadales bacterium]